MRKDRTVIHQEQQLIVTVSGKPQVFRVTWDGKAVWDNRVPNPKALTETLLDADIKREYCRLYNKGNISYCDWMGMVRKLVVKKLKSERKILAKANGRRGERGR